MSSLQILLQLQAYFTHRNRTTHEDYLMVSIVARNLVGISAVSFENMLLLIVCEFGFKWLFAPTLKAGVG